MSESPQSGNLWRNFFDFCLQHKIQYVYSQFTALKYPEQDFSTFTLNFSFKYYLNLFFQDPSIVWNVENWAYSCDRPNDDIPGYNPKTNVSSLQNCINLCRYVSGCTFFDYKVDLYLCWLKNAVITKSNCSYMHDYTQICGFP
jgi:hypothetical protein